MTLVPRFARTLLLALTLAAASLTFAGHAEAADARKAYKCPPCSSPCDTTTFWAPGTCPTCGMALVEATSAAALPHPDQKKVAVLVFNGCELLDFSGPYEMFGAAGCDVFTVAATKDPITTAMGLTVVPRYTFADAPQPEVLVIPGGAIRAAAKDEPTLAFIRKTTEGTKQTMSVCNGAFILANTGLLDGLSATTTNGNIPRMTQQFPKVHVVHDQRYVDNGHLVTTAGLSAGMDGALHVIAKLFGTGYAQQVALGEEYDWEATSKYARAALADNEIPNVDMDSMGKWHVVSTAGDTGHWELVMSGEPSLPPETVVQKVEQAFTDGKWTRVNATGASPAPRTSTWTFTGSDGKPWKGSLKFGPTLGDGGTMTAAVSITRAG
jgi:putative intracellular protease/amidase